VEVEGFCGKHGDGVGLQRLVYPFLHQLSPWTKSVATSVYSSLPIPLPQVLPAQIPPKNILLPSTLPDVPDKSKTENPKRLKLLAKSQA